MARNVIILASGETERRALPHLLAHLRDRGISVVEVRIPPRNGALSVQMAERLIKRYGMSVLASASLRTNSLSSGFQGFCIEMNGRPA